MDVRQLQHVSPEELNALLQAGRKLLDDRTYPNMDDLPELSIGTVLANVETLFLQEQHEKPGSKKISKIYSQVGPVLIALNPFCALPCYSETWQAAYRMEGLQGTIYSAWQRLGPHCFGTTEEVYQALIHHPKQSVVICGESGAGKTVTNGKMLGYLLEIGGHTDRKRTMTVSSQTERTRTPARTQSWACGVEARKMQLQAANELLESYGNAKTGRNDNSSRFGKYSQLFFEGDPLVVCGLQMEHYLLERSRIVHVAGGERNYHIMHMLAAEERQEDGRENKTFKYLEDAETVTKADGKKFDNLDELEKLRDLMDQAEFDEDNQESIYDSIKGVLYLGNTVFEHVEQGSNDASAKLAEHSRADFETACTLFGVQPAVMLQALTTKVIKEPGGQMITTGIDEIAAASQRDSVAKTVYSRIFDDIVAFLNSKLGDVANCMDKPVIGLLDIFGFEDMPVNGFEQMFINLTNEWIQHHFNNVMFKKEMEAYKEEGIELVFTRPENWKCVELFVSDRSPAGIIKLLQDRVTTPNAKDGKEFVDSTLNRNLRDVPHYTVADPKLVQKIVQGKQPKWPKVKISVRYEECFQVSHYAGDILYTVQDFISKSKDGLSENMTEALRSSDRKKILKIFQRSDDEEGSKGGNKSAKTVGQHFKLQLKDLMDTLESSQSLFVRCIKPNPEMKPGRFDSALVLEQLTCGGVVSALEMRAAGLPDRVDYAMFIKEFWCLEWNTSTADKNQRSMRDRTKELMKVLVGPEDEDPARYRLGSKRLFLKSGVLNMIRDVLTFTHKRSANMVQRKWRAVKGLSLLTRLHITEQKRQQVEAEARQHGVEKVPAIANTLAQVKRRLQEGEEKVKDNASEWELIVKAQKSAVDQKPLTKRDEKAAGGILQTLSSVELDEIDGLVAHASAETAKAVKRKQVFEAALAKEDTAMKLEVNGYYAKIVEVDQLCVNAATDSGQKDIKDKCAAAKATIDQIIEKRLPEIIKQAMEQADFSKDITEVKLPPDSAKLLAEASELCKEAETAAVHLAERKRKFEQEAFEASDEVKELKRKFDAARERLELLQGDCKEAIMEGFSEVAKSIDEAWRLDTEIKELRQSAMDPKRFLQAIRDFLTAEQAAQDGVERMRRLETEARDRELQNLQNCILMFPKAKELQQVAMTFLGLLGEFRQHLDGDSQKDMGLRTQESTRQVLNERLHTAQVATEALGLEIVDTSGKPDTAVVFHYDGPWSVECFKLLGPDVADYEGVAKVLDEGRFGTVVEAVEALNAGLVGLEDGYCIGYSETWQQYYMLFQKATEKEAMEVLGSTRSARKAEQSKSLRFRFKNAVQAAVDSEGRQKIEDSIAQKQQALEQRIRDNMSEELDESYKAKADAEISKVQFEAKEEISKAVTTAQKEVKEAKATMEEKETKMRHEIGNLTRLVKAQEAKGGSFGELPKLNAGLLDCGIVALRMGTGLGELVGRVAASAEDVNEALQRVTALKHNPETLPCLTELSQAVTRAQRSQLEMEVLTRELGLPQHSMSLPEAREKLEQLARRCQGLATNNFQGPYVEVEVQHLGDNLDEVMKLLMQLKHRFDNWIVRVENGEGLINQAQAVFSIDLADLPEQPQVRPEDPGLLDRLTSGLMENFCATYRPAGEPAPGAAAARSSHLLPQLAGSTSSGASNRQTAITLQLNGGNSVDMRTDDSSAAADPHVAQRASQASTSKQGKNKRGSFELVEDSEPRRRSRSPPEDSGDNQAQLLWGASRTDGYDSMAALRQKHKNEVMRTEVGDQVLILPARQLTGTVCFSGQADFAAGEWLGVALDGPFGLNDGSVNGVYYFDCEPFHGLFIRPHLVERTKRRAAQNPGQEQRTGKRPVSRSKPSSKQQQQQHVGLRGKATWK